MLSRCAPLLLLLLGACRREAPPPPRPAAPAPPPAADAPAAPIAPAPPPCGPVFAPDDAVTLPAAEGDDVRLLSAACDGERLAARWRVGAAEGWATHPLRDASRWAAGTYEPSPGSLSLSTAVVAGEAWSAQRHRDDSLSLRRLGEGGAETRASLLAMRPRELSGPQLLWVEGGRALVALHGRVSGGEREVWLLAFGAGPVSWTAMARGSIGATAPGERALVTAVVTRADGTVWLRGRWLDARAALRALVGGRVSAPRAWLTDASIRLPHRGIAFSPAASAEGALLYQGVIGAERGGAGLARFGRDGAAEDVFLGAIPSALGDVLSSGGAHAARWWDERYRPVARRYRGERVEAAEPPGEAVGDAFAALDAGRLTRRLRCGEGEWSLRMEPTRLRARRVDCVAQARTR